MRVCDLLDALHSPLAQQQLRLSILCRLSVRAIGVSARAREQLVERRARGLERLAAAVGGGVAERLGRKALAAQELEGIRGENCLRQLVGGVVGSILTLTELRKEDGRATERQSGRGERQAQSASRQMRWRCTAGSARLSNESYAQFTFPFLFFPRLVV